MPTFDIGLVVAGAVSAGSFTAGAVDFLLQTLDAWYADKAAGAPDCPPRGVRLRAMNRSFGRSHHGRHCGRHLG